MSRGILLINLGSPDSPRVSDVRRYLAQFLMDRYVIDVPWLLRAFIIYGLVLPKRPQRTAEAYASVWTEAGSPLLVYSRALRDAFRQHLPFHQTEGDLSPIPVVDMAMRYGKPSIPEVLRQLRRAGITELTVVPLYPHYAMSSTRTAEEEVHKTLGRLKWAPLLNVVPPFYAHPRYIGALVKRIQKSLVGVSWEHLLFSYHGLPERHLRKTDPTRQHCLKQGNCCQVPAVAHLTCYRHQVMQTTALVAAAMGLSPDQYSVSFQSRLGRDKWLEPFTDPHVDGLVQRGVKHLAVVCPAFVADCLETIEEIGEVTRERFLHAGGETFTLVPCLNADPEWVDALVEIVG